MTNQNDLSVVESVLTGNVSAYASIVDSYKDITVALAYNILLNREDAEEVAQDAFLKAYRSLSSFKGTAKFSTWLYRIVVNTALNKKKLKKHCLAQVSTFTNDMPAESNDTVYTETAMLQKKHIQFAMRSLTENERICVSLFYLNECTVDEINESRGISSTNIKVLLYRARKKLHKSLYNLIKNELRT